MTFGQGQAQNFIIPMPQQQAAGGGGGGRPAGPAKEPDFDFKDYGLGDPQVDLQATDNVSEAVTQYYQDFANAKKFAKTMWKQHGIDVLAPSGDNQFSVIASNTFNKMIANLWDTYNKAKQGAAQLDKAAQAQMEGKGFINPQAMAQGRFFSQPDVSQRFTSTEVPEYIRVAKENISRTVDNQADFNRLMQDKRIVLDQAQRIYDANPTEQNRIALEAAKTMSPIRNYGKGYFAASSVNGSGNAASLAGAVTVYKGSHKPRKVAVVEGENALDRFGYAMAAGDMNGDGMPDLIVGAPLHSASPSLYQQGAVYVYFGPSFDPDRFLKISASATLQGIGYSLATGDINNDGVDDLLIGASGKVIGYYGGSYSHRRSRMW